MILQLKTGRLDAAYFRNKFDIDILDQFSEGFAKLQSEGLLRVGDGEVRLTDDGYMQVDRHLLTFFEPEHVTSRYT